MGLYTKDLTLTRDLQNDDFALPLEIRKLTYRRHWVILIIVALRTLGHTNFTLTVEIQEMQLWQSVV